MGREIRRVPKGWEHPKYAKDDAGHPNQIGQYKPLFYQDFDSAIEEWFANHLLWKNGDHPDQKDGSNSEYKYYHQWNGGPPDPDHYRPQFESPPVCFQVYETVSEGTPVTPVFETKEALVEHLTKHGTAWDHGRGWNREVAVTFVELEWAPSMIMTGGKLYDGPEGLAAIKKEDVK